MGNTFSFDDRQTAFAKGYPIFMSDPNGTNHMFIPVGLGDGDYFQDPRSDGWGVGSTIQVK